MCLCQAFLAVVITQLGWPCFFFPFLSQTGAAAAAVFFLSLGHIHRCSLKGVVYVREK